jgi:hypothetical protein
MFLKLLKSFLFLLVFTNISLTQDLYLCESYTEDGTPIGPINRLEIKPYGTAIYVLLDYQKEFDDPILYLFVDKFTDGKFTAFDSKTISIKEDETWAVTSFEFKEQGTYEVYFLNSKHSRLASNKVEIFFSEEYGGQPFTPTISSYNDSQLIFCELVINGKPINPFNTLSLSRSGGQAFIYYKNYIPFGIEVIKAQFWKRSSTNSNYEELVESKKYKILPEWNDTYIKYHFKNIGEYKIDIFDNNDNFISSNIITITN